MRASIVKAKAANACSMMPADARHIWSRCSNSPMRFQGEHQRTRQFGELIKGLDILEPSEAKLTLPDGTSRSLTGFQCVSREKLNALTPDKVAGMLANGMLELIYLHLYSMRTFDDLMRKLSNGRCGLIAPCRGARQVFRSWRSEARRARAQATFLRRRHQLSKAPPASDEAPEFPHQRWGRGPRPRPAPPIQREAGKVVACADDYHAVDAAALTVRNGMVPSSAISAELKALANCVSASVTPEKARAVSVNAPRLFAWADSVSEEMGVAKVRIMAPGPNPPDSSGAPAGNRRSSLSLR